MSLLRFLPQEKHKEQLKGLRDAGQESFALIVEEYKVIIFAILFFIIISRTYYKRAGDLVRWDNVASKCR